MSVLGDCTLGRPDLEATSPNLTSGTYIDMTSPASCSGQITQWDYCYYPQDIGINANRFLVIFQVWRLSSAQSGVLVGQSTETIIILPSTESFQCNSIVLSMDDYITVAEGDFLGLRLSGDALPAVANSNISGAQLLFIPASFFIPSVIDSTTNVQNRVLHVTAEIGKNLYL